ncbi:unnamed protein product, partial [Medioppia subpectinata]
MPVCLTRDKKITIRYIPCIESAATLIVVNNSALNVNHKMVKNEENELVVKKKVPVVQWDYYGLNNSCFGPSFVDFKYVLGTTLSWISLFPMLESTIGYLYKYLNRQITLIIFISLMGFSTSLLPFSQTLSQFYTCVFGYGLGSGVWFSAYNVWVIEIWQQNSAP